MKAKHIQKQSDQQKSRTYIFENASVPRAVWTLAIPTIITQLINIIYNYADTWYVGRTQNAGMMATLSVCMPIYVIMAALANLFGIGGSSAISRSLGRGNPCRARKIFAFSLYGGAAAAVLYAIFMLLFRPRIIWAIGGDSSSYSFIYSYIFWTIILGSVPSVGNVLCGHLVRSIGAAREAGIGMSMGGILNMMLDPLFMFVILPPGMEVTGAAVATLLSNCASLLYFIVFLLKNRDNPVFTISPKDLSVQDGIPGEVFSIGIPAALQTTLAMVSNIFANRLVVEYGSAAVAGMGVAKKINMLAFNTCMGLTQGVLPLIAYNFGAGNYRRMKSSIAYTAAVALVFACACTVLFRTFSTQLVTFFIDEADSVSFGAQFLDVIAFAAPLCALSYMTNTVFQAAGRRKSSFLLSIMRKGIVDIPAMFVFKSFIGMYGVVWATPFAEVVSAAVAVVLFFSFMRSLQQEENTLQ